MSLSFTINLEPQEGQKIPISVKNEINRSMRQSLDSLTRTDLTYDSQQVSRSLLGLVLFYNNVVKSATININKNSVIDKIVSGSETAGLLDYNPVNENDFDTIPSTLPQAVNDLASQITNVENSIYQPGDILLTERDPGNGYLDRSINQILAKAEYSALASLYDPLPDFGSSLIDLTSVVTRGNSDWGYIKYADGSYLASIKGIDEYIYSTDQGVTWQLGNFGKAATFDWGPIAYGNGNWVVLNSVYTQFIYSDSIEGPWSISDITESTSTNCVEWCGTRFIAINGGYGNKVQYSIDGINWTAGTLPASEYWKEIAYSPTLELAIVCCDVTSNRIATITDTGISWNSLFLSLNVSWTSITWGGDRFVIVSGSNNDDTAVSLDGTNWSYGKLPSKSDWSIVRYSNNYFICLSKSSPIGAFSSDGLNWTQFDLPESVNWNYLSGNNGVFFGLPIDGDNMIKIDNFSYNTETHFYLHRKTSEIGNVYTKI